ncbi:MAG: class I SAM-dependent methyltransferase [Planctomycetota bacterium]|nr:class I SAM-dependent methyltransferase [Planctomycetota bacterium]
MDQQLKDQQDLYDGTWTGGLERGKEQRGNLQTNLEFLSRTGLLRPGDRILEIGCGIGAVVSTLAGQGCRVTGTDISRVAIEYGQSKYPGLDLQVQAAEELAFADETFEVVLSFDLFEHIAQIDRHVSEVHRVLKPQGHYLFQTPNKLSNATFETLSHRSLKWRRYHPSLHTPGQLRRRLGRHGFEVSFVKVNSINEFTRAKLKKFGPLGSLIAHVNFEKLPLGLQTNLYVVARKRD